MNRPGDTPRPLASGPREIYKDLFLLQLAALILLSDQFTKFLVRAFLPFRHSFPEEGFLRITHAHNTGSAFGLFQGQNVPLILVAIGGITILILIYYSQRNPTGLLRFSLGLQLGGAFGNLVDRVRLGHVTDFLDVGPWPVFNVADSSIVIGLVLLGWLFARPRGRPGRRAAEEAGAQAEPSVTPSQELTPGTWCPVCDGEMVSVPQGRRCSSCGVIVRTEEPRSGQDLRANFPVADTVPGFLDGVQGDIAELDSALVSPSTDEAERSTAATSDSLAQREEPANGHPPFDDGDAPAKPVEPPAGGHQG